MKNMFIVPVIMLLIVLPAPFLIGREVESPAEEPMPIVSAPLADIGLSRDIAGLRQTERDRNVLYLAIIREAEHIRESVTMEGAINMVPITEPGQGAYIIPYFAVYASIGLDVAALLIKERDLPRAFEYLDLSENFYDWYSAHMNPDGSMYDYTEGSVEAPKATGDADSEDAYAGVFLYGVYVHYSVVRTIDQARADEFLARMEPFCRKAANIIVSLQQSDGLTIAKRDYRIQYLMDNLESYGGLKALRQLGLTEFDEYAEKIAKAINERLWLEEGYFAWAKDPHDDTLSSGWNEWYPDKMANTWAIYFNFVGQEKRDTIYRALRQEFSKPKSTYSKVGPGIIYLAMAALVQRDTSAAVEYMMEALKYQDQDGGFRDSYGYTNLSGWFIIAAGLHLAWNDLAGILLM